MVLVQSLTTPRLGGVKQSTWPIPKARTIIIDVQRQSSRCDDTILLYLAHAYGSVTRSNTFLEKVGCSYGLIGSKTVPK